MTGWGYYVLSMDMHNFSKAGMRDSRHSTDHWMVLAVLQV